MKPQGQLHPPRNPFCACPSGIEPATKTLTQFAERTAADSSAPSSTAC